MIPMTRSIVLLERLSSAYGVPGFSESETNRYTLEIDDHVFYFFDEPERSTLYIQVDVAEYTDSESTESLTGLMKLNHLWDATQGGIFGLDINNSVFSYNYKIQYPLTPADDYDEYLIDLVPEIIRCIQYARETLSHTEE